MLKMDYMVTLCALTIEKKPKKNNKFQYYK